MSAPPRNTTRYVICPVGEIAPGDRRIVEIAGRSIGVFNIHGRYYAIRNLCPHQGAPLCRGRLTGTALPSRPGEYHWGREGEIIRCPWHGWEFDVTTGKSLFNPHKMKVKNYEVMIEAAEGDDPSLETYDVRLERDEVVLYL